MKLNTAAPRPTLASNSTSINANPRWLRSERQRFNSMDGRLLAARRADHAEALTTLSANGCVIIVAASATAKRVLRPPRVHASAHRRSLRKLLPAFGFRRSIQLGRSALPADE